MKLRIALIGYGSAGRSREKACHGIDNVDLAGIVSRRQNVGSLSLDGVLGDQSIEAVAISTENASHPELVAQCLSANKHVLCDYPLAFTSQQAQSLFKLAQSKKKILHVEHIGLLTVAHREAKEYIRRSGSLIEGHYRFTGGWNDKLADETYSGPLPFVAFSRLLQVADWFGPFNIAHFDFSADRQHFRVLLNLQFTNGGVMQFLGERKDGLARGRDMEAKLANGFVSLENKQEPHGLFAKDLSHFVDRVTSEAACYYDENLMIETIGELSRQSTQKFLV